jgi:hypothetical protein
MSIFVLQYRGYGHQVKTIALMVKAILEHQTGVQAELVRPMGNQEASLKQLSRLIHNDRLDPRRLAEALLAQTLAHLPKRGRIRVALDWSRHQVNHPRLGQTQPFFNKCLRCNLPLSARCIAFLLCSLSSALCRRSKRSRVKQRPTP